MAKLKKPIDTSKTEGQNVAPEGKYTLVATKTEIKSSQSNKDNKYIAVFFKIAKGQFKGMAIFNNYNYWNENETAQNMARVQWKNLILAIFGKDKVINDTDEILNRPFDVELGIKEDDFGKKNVIKKYISSDETSEPEKKKKDKKKDKMKESAWADDENEPKKGKKKDKKNKKK